MSTTNASRRAYGAGELFTKTDSQGRETWYGRWRAPDGSRPKRRIAPRRGAGWTDGLTRTQAEAELRKLIAVAADEQPTRRRPGERVTLAEAERQYRGYLETKRRKRSTITGVESAMRTWWLPLFGDRTLGQIRPEDVDEAIGMMETGRRPGTSGSRRCKPKTVVNYVGILGAVYHYAMHPRRRWATYDPTDAVDLPEVEENVDIRYLDPLELDALVGAAAPGDFHELDATLFLVAAQTGLRHGELIALRRRDVDWTVMRIRVRQNYVLGEFGTPKSRRSTRSVPMSDEVGGALARFLEGAPGDDDELVFGNRDTGEPLSKSCNLDRFRKALAAARLDETLTLHCLRHTFGTRMAAVGTPMRTLQEWMGHRDIATTQRYADYAPRLDESELVARAFLRGPIQGPILSEPQST